MAKPRTGCQPAKGKGNFGDLSCGKTVGVTSGVHGVVGDGMERSWCDVNQGSRSGKGGRSWTEIGPKSPPEGDRVLVIAKKRGNSRGAKGDRKVEA